MTVSYVSAEGGDGAPIHLFVSAETPNQDGQVLVNFAENERIRIDPPWAVNASAVSMPHALPGRVTFEAIECTIPLPDG